MAEDIFPGIHGAAYKELAKRFGGLFRTTFRIVAAPGVGVAAELAKGNADRVFILFQNVGANGVTIGTTPQMAASAGLTVAPLTDRSFNLNDHAVLPCETWYITGAVTEGLNVLEVFRDTAHFPKAD